VRLQEVLYNLLSSAMKFTHGGRIHVEAAIEDSVAQISVTDTGVGIPAPEQEPVSAISEHRVEAHGGRVWLRSERGKGSRFAFTMPLEKCAEEVQ
jgi:two-component system, sensor histidine kinase ChiS